MKVIVVLSLFATAFGSLEPAGYRPPGSAPFDRYLPAQETPSAAYLPVSASPSRLLDAPVTSYGLPAVPADRYLPVGDAFAGLRSSGYGRDAGEESVPAKYDFRYEVKDNYGNDFGQRESRDGDETRGVYAVLLPDGRRQIVEYTADKDGFKPRISYEEPGYSRDYPGAPY